MDLGHELASAAAQGNLAKVRELLAQGLDPNGLNAYGRTPIQVGAAAGELSPTTPLGIREAGAPMPQPVPHPAPLILSEGGSDRCSASSGRGPRCSRSRARG